MDQETLYKLVGIGVISLIPLIMVIAAGVELWRGITVARLLRKGDAAFRRGDLDVAERCYTDALTHKRGRKACHLRLGILYSRPHLLHKSSAAFVDALNANEPVKYEHVERLATRLSFKPTRMLFDNFRRAELNYLSKKLRSHRSPSSFSPDASGVLDTLSTAIQLQRVYRQIPPPPKPEEYILLGVNKLGEHHIARPRARVHAGATVWAEVAFDETDRGIRVAVTIISEQKNIQTSMLDAQYAFAVDDARLMTNSAITTLLQGWNAKGERELLDQMSIDVNRVLGFIGRFSRGRRLHDEISDVTVRFQKHMPIYWHEGQHSYEFLAGRERFNYRLRFWPQWVCITSTAAIELTTSPRRWILSKEDIECLAERIELKIGTEGVS